MMYGMYGWNGDWGAMLLAMLLNSIVWIALIGLLVWGATRLLGNRQTTPTERLDANSPALEILRRRYARGEIDEVVFERMRRHLEASAGRDALDIPAVIPPER